MRAGSVIHKSLQAGATIIVSVYYDEFVLMRRQVFIFLAGYIRRRYSKKKYCRLGEFGKENSLIKRLVCIFDYTAEIFSSIFWTNQVEKVFFLNGWAALFIVAVCRNENSHNHFLKVPFSYLHYLNVINNWRLLASVSSLAHSSSLFIDWRRVEENAAKVKSVIARFLSDRRHIVIERYQTTRRTISYILNDIYIYVYLEIFSTWLSLCHVMCVRVYSKK
jgi:hypothetical protein